MTQKIGATILRIHHLSLAENATDMVQNTPALEVGIVHQGGICEIGEFMSNNDVIDAAIKYFNEVTKQMPQRDDHSIWEHPNKGFALIQQQEDCVACLITDGSTISAWTSKHFTPEQTVKAFKDFLSANPKKEEKPT